MGVVRGRSNRVPAAILQSVLPLRYGRPDGSVARASGCEEEA